MLTNYSTTFNFNTSHVASTYSFSSVDLYVLFGSKIFRRRTVRRKKKEI